MEPEIDPAPGEASFTDITDEQRAAMMEWLATHPYGDQDENGVDLSSLRRNLRLTPGQRLERLQQAVDSLTEIRDARTRHTVS